MNTSWWFSSQQRFFQMLSNPTRIHLIGHFFKPKFSRALLSRWKNERIWLRMLDGLLCFISIFCHQNHHQSHLDSRAKTSEVLYSKKLKKVIREKIKMVALKMWVYFPLGVAGIIEKFRSFDAVFENMKTVLKTVLRLLHGKDPKRIFQ